ncbi:sensor histidine kinase [Actibacterium ureilyticum]|uniref:sensor histidine kinase n=1 Tax=Actibacterium ureilyticum TaxID=1590614 RepID=UPI000BAAFC74|nr:HAMP domain-containing sensor histidine kinase [Actibacterium ureilyticum]
MSARLSLLRVRLGAAAALMGAVTLAATLLTVTGMARIGDRIGASIAAERRIDSYATLSTQVSQFLVIALEAAQTGLPQSQRATRIDRLSQDISRSFAQLRRDNAEAVAAVGQLGLDAQSRTATRSLLIARMEAHFGSARDALMASDMTAEQLTAFLNAFSSGFDPQLNAAVTGELRSRELIIADIARLRGQLVRWALLLGGVGAVLAAAVYFGLVGPQFRRLDLLAGAARRIGRGDFAIALPDGARDEIGGLFRETNRAAHALAQRKAQVDAEWAGLRDTIADRTEALRQANAELSQIDENRRRFFADVSHELRTPLTVILMEAQLARKAAGDRSAALETIERRALRMGRRIDDLLRVARSESGALELETAAFDLSQAVREAVVDARDLANSAGMQVTLDAETPVSALGDANWMRQVVTGLIDNAVRHARAGQAVQVTVRQGADVARVQVTDNGPGIAVTPPEAVFERFRKGRPGEGFGIGLALAKWVMQAQGGQIAVQSPVPDADRIGDAPGTRITLCLPLVEGAA